MTWDKFHEGYGVERYSTSDTTPRTALSENVIFLSK